ncbi:MAG TPA: hypothetical protein VLW26_10545 [Steroidobacteraceae bacterium]|nr:hypothetical protein [Steroidobacteraceae bacterium]
MALLAALVAMTTASPAMPAAPGSTYHLAQEVPLPGDEGWDDLAYSPRSGLLYITHGTVVQVVDGHTFKLVQTIPDVQGGHAVAIAEEIGLGFASAGRADSVVEFELNTLARLAVIKTTGSNPDAIAYDPTTRRVFSFNGRGRNVTAIDAQQSTVIGTIALDAKPEFAVADGKGHLYVNLEDKNSLAVIDPRKLAVREVWPLSGCEEPSGLAIDVPHQRLFSVCSNKTMLIVDARNGRVLATLPIGGRVDGVAFDDAAQLAFASGGDGTITVVHEDSPDHFSVTATVPTRLGARTITVDPVGHRVFSVTAKFGAPPPTATPGTPAARPTLEPGSFRLLVVEP